jgi:hypothetical protein
MDHEPVTTCDMLSDLLLNQCLSKREVSNIANTSVRSINKALFGESTPYFKEYQIARLFRLYERLKRYEHKIEEYLTVAYGGRQRRKSC